MSKYRTLVMMLFVLLSWLNTKAQVGDSEHIFTVTDKPSTPLMGEKKLSNLISSFAKEHSEYGGAGPEMIWFVVKSNGEIGEIRPPLHLGGNINIYKFNAEVELVKSLKYTPATLHGKPVSSWQSVSVPYERKEVSTDGMVAVGELDVRGNSSSSSKSHNSSAKAADLESKVFDVVEQMPTFPGGLYYLMSYLSENVQYPEDAQKQGIQGRVVVSFIIEKDGTLSDIKVVRSVNPSLDEEALRVVRNMPNWVPGKQSGKGVRVKFNVPINFKL